MSHSKLICLAFSKAKSEEEQTGIVKPSKSRLASRLSSEVENRTGFPFGEKSLLNYYNTARSTKAEILKIPQLEVINALLHYCNFETYEAFVLQEQKSAPGKEVQFNRFFMLPGRLRVEFKWSLKFSV